MIPQSVSTSDRQINYAIEKFSDCVFEIVRHVSRHWEEFASRKDIRMLDVDWEKLLYADRVGQIVLATARHGPDDRMIGYLLMSVHKDTYSKTTPMADSLAYYVEERPMRGLIQRNLIRFMRNHLLAKGIRYQRLTMSMERNNDAILRSCGYEPDTVLYVLKG